MIDQQQLADLRAKAEAATKGPWVVEHHDGWWTVSGAKRSEVFDDGSANGEYAPACKQNNRDFIAAANPATVLALLDEIERLRERNTKLERVRDAAEPCVDALRDIAGDGHGEYLDQWAAAIEALDAAKEKTDG